MDFDGWGPGRAAPFPARSGHDVGSARALATKLPTRAAPGAVVAGQPWLLSSHFRLEL